MERSRQLRLPQDKHISLMPSGPLQHVACTTDFDTPGVGGRELEEIEAHNGQIEQKGTRAFGCIHGLERRVIQIAYVPSREFVSKANDAICPLGLCNSGHNDTWELVRGAVL